MRQQNPQPQAVRNVSDNRQPWRAPRLAQFGSVVKLTASGSGQQGERNYGGNCKQGNTFQNFRC